MALTYLFIKIFPIFGISLTVICVDIARSLKRKGNKAWIGVLMFGSLFALATVAWAIFRGDKNADLWFNEIVSWLHHTN